MSSLSHARSWLSPALGATLLLAMLLLLAGCSDTAVVLALEFTRKIPEDLDTVCLQISQAGRQRFAKSISVVNYKASRPTLTVEQGDSEPAGFEYLLRGERRGLPVSWRRESVLFIQGEISRLSVRDEDRDRKGARFINGGRLSVDEDSVLAAMPTTATQGDMVLSLSGEGSQHFGTLPGSKYGNLTDQFLLPSPPQKPIGALVLNVMSDAVFGAREAGDCDMDVLVLGEDRPQLWVQQDGNFKASGATLLQGAWTAAATGDLKRSGRADIVLGSVAGVALLIDTGGASFEIVQNPGLSQAPQVAALAVGLLDGDEAPDILIGTPTGKDILLSNDAQNMAQFTQVNHVGLTDADEQTVALAVAHLAGTDFQSMDVIRATKTGVQVLLNKEGTFEMTDVLPSGLDYGGVTEILARDLNQDGTVDLVLVRPAGSHVLYNTGSRENPSYQPAPLDAGVNTHASRAVAADLDGDGLLDLVFGGDTSAIVGGTYWIRQVAN